MSVAILFVEGSLEMAIFTHLLRGNPALRRGGSKYTLKARAGTERAENGIAAAYLRDRDFDFDPPEDLSSPTIDASSAELPWGWRWCRHELENYLLEPTLVSEAMGWQRSDFENALCESALKIRDYQAARWAIGTARRSLPPAYELRTKPDELDKRELGLPACLDKKVVRDWATQSIEEHRQRFVSATESGRVESSFESFLTRFDGEFVQSLEQILLWFSGKDLLVGMSDWLVTQKLPNAGLLRADVRDWIIAHPERALELLPEWKQLVDALRG